MFGGRLLFFARGLRYLATGAVKWLYQEKNLKKLALTT